MSVSKLSLHEARFFLHYCVLHGFIVFKFTKFAKILQFSFDYLIQKACFKLNELQKALSYRNFWCNWSIWRSRSTFGTAMQNCWANTRQFDHLLRAPANVFYRFSRLYRRINSAIRSTNIKSTIKIAALNNWIKYSSYNSIFTIFNFEF